MIRRPFFNVLIFITLAGVLASCASTPEFDTTQVDQSLTPQGIVAEPDFHKGKTVLWGGTILDTRNLEEATHIEILAYPLDSSYRPQQDSTPQGRFIIQHQGYLEPTNYAQGRVLTVLGKVYGSQTGNVGESSYTYAVINSDQLHLWSADSGSDRSNVHFGIGIGIGKQF